MLMEVVKKTAFLPVLLRLHRCYIAVFRGFRVSREIAIDVTGE
jgi:hypothetical protein